MWQIKIMGFLFFSAGDVCGLPKQPGMCMGYFQKWFYSTKTGECEFFIYGGCQGNANNFDSEDECKEACSGNLTFEISNN